MNRNITTYLLRSLKCRLFGHVYDEAKRHFDPAIVNSRGEANGGWTFPCKNCGRWFSTALNRPIYFEAKLHKALAESICYGKCGDPTCEEAINHA